MIAGVCGGIAQTYDIDVNLVRGAFAIAGLFFGMGPLMLYAGAAFVVPDDDGSIEARKQTAMDWDGDNLRLTYKAPVIPYTFPWTHWLGGWAGAAALAGVAMACFSLIAMGIAAFGGAPLDPIAPIGWLTATPGMVAGALAISALLGMIRRPYTITCSHAALWIDMPLRKPRRIDLADVESLVDTGDDLELRLIDGDAIALPKPAEEELAILLGVVESSITRAVSHEDDLEQSAAERDRLRRIMAQKRPKQTS